MRFACRAGASFALVLICAAVGAEDSRSPHAPLRTLVTASEAHRLTIEEAARAYPVHLRVVVTVYNPYIDPRQAALFVHDDSGSIFVAIPKRPILPIHAGTLIELVGVTGNGDYAPIITNAKVRVIGEFHVPETAIKATMLEMTSGQLDGQWVEIEGVVHAVHLPPGDAVFDIATTGGMISATTLSVAGMDYNALVDSFVRIHGNAGPVFNRKLQMVGVHILFPPMNLPCCKRPLPIHFPCPSAPFPAFCVSPRGWSLPVACVCREG